MCGLQVDVEDDHVKLIRGDRDDVWSKGYLCPKGTTLGHLHEDPDRIRVPMVRDGDTWREVTWDEAFARCEELIHGVLELHGITSATAFVGNPVGHSFTLGRYMPLFIGQSGMPHIYSSGTIDQWPKNVSCILMYGNMWKIPAPDIQRTDYLICMGGNPQASGGSLLACPDVLGELDKIRGRGGKVVVIATTCGRRATSAPRARPSVTCTTTPTASASRWCATATRGGRCRGTRPSRAAKS
jgi:anaerobic selenocysteine-containing dehydrogenase